MSLLHKDNSYLKSILHAHAKARRQLVWTEKLLKGMYNNVHISHRGNVHTVGTDAWMATVTVINVSALQRTLSTSTGPASIEWVVLCGRHISTKVQTLYAEPCSCSVSKSQKIIATSTTLLKRNEDSWTKKSSVEKICQQESNSIGVRLSKSVCTAKPKWWSGKLQAHWILIHIASQNACACQSCKMAGPGHGNKNTL